jgi:quercetin dioxygenase-like cupin family protein
MKILRFDDIPKVPASHEDPSNPGVLKKVLFHRQDLFEGRIQMINWAFLPPGKSFRSHYHQDMQELFILMAPGAIARVDEKEIVLNRGDALMVDPGETHEMKNSTNTEIEYIVVGIAGENKGKSINV